MCKIFNIQNFNLQYTHGIPNKFLKMKMKHKRSIGRPTSRWIDQIMSDIERRYIWREIWATETREERAKLRLF